MRRWKLFSSAVGGASALEFALILPVFATLLFGTIQVGLALYFAGTVQYVLERTARMVMVDQTMSVGQAKQAFAAQLAAYTDQHITLNYAVDGSGTIPIAQLSAAYVHEFIIPFVPSFSVTFDAQERVPLKPA